jgi:hypothetical protein
VSQPAPLPFRGYRGRALHALAVLTALLLVLAGSVGFGAPGRITPRPPLQSLVSRDVDVKALRPQQELGVRGATSPIRLGGADKKAIRPVVGSPQRVAAERSTTQIYEAHRLSDYLRQRTNGPRAPPQANA